MQEVEIKETPASEIDQKQKALLKIVAMMEYAEPILLTFPKYVRFTRVADITKCMDKMMERTIEANKKYYKKTTLQELDVEIEKLRKYVYLAFRLKYINAKKYEMWSRKVDEIGRLVGAWIQKVKQ